MSKETTLINQRNSKNLLLITTIPANLAQEYLSIFVKLSEHDKLSKNQVQILCVDDPLPHLLSGIALKSLHTGAIYSLILERDGISVIRADQKNLNREKYKFKGIRKLLIEKGRFRIFGVIRILPFVKISFIYENTELEFYFLSSQPEFMKTLSILYEISKLDSFDEIYSNDEEFKKIYSQIRYKHSQFENGSLIEIYREWTKDYVKADMTLVVWDCDYLPLLENEKQVDDLIYILKENISRFEPYMPLLFASTKGISEDEKYILKINNLPSVEVFSKRRKEYRDKRMVRYAIQIIKELKPAKLLLIGVSNTYKRLIRVAKRRDVEVSILYRSGVESDLINEIPKTNVIKILF